MIRIRDLEPYLCAPSMSVRDALARLNASEHLFQLIAEQDRVLLGTLTDGDVRRALLQGVSLDAPVSECIRTDYIAGCAGTEGANQALLRESPRPVDFVPVVDERGRVVEVLVRDGAAAPIAHAIVMAGGFGTRLGARTEDTPKPLLPVGGRPILEHIIARLEDAGVADIHVAVHYLADQIKSFVTRRDNRAEIHLVEEDTPLGTAGALGRMAALADAPVLVVNGDVITSVDVAALHDFHVRHGHDATVGVAQYEVDVPFGVVRYGEDGLFAGIEEKPRIANFIAAGVYYLAPQFLALVPDDRPMDMPELLNLGKEIGLRIGLFPIHEYWTDVGQPRDLEAADDFLTNGRPAAER